MSGIVGILHFDGAPVDRHLLEQMTGFMASRGPDAQEIWTDHNVGFGHALLKTTDESEHERQSFTLDGRLWIVADARVDARRELIPQLRTHGHENLSAQATDVELILCAYLTWGENCAEHLLGDFAFAIWDRPQQRLFCARDQLGVKPFFYAHIGRRLVFSSSLDCIRQHPSVSDRLNDLAIADFLLFDLNQDLATTSFADIQRLPPAHSAKWSARKQELSRYWTLPVDEPLYFSQADDYVNRFQELLEQAVDDRLRTKKVGIMMSGGLDSPTLAATACKIFRRGPSDLEIPNSKKPGFEKNDCEVRAFTTVLDGVMDSNERYYAGMVAEHLHIPIHFFDRSEKLIDPDWEEAAARTPEPVLDTTNLVLERQEHREMAAYSRVSFYGEGPDNALRPEWQAYLSYLVRKRQFARLAKSACELVIRSRRIPFLGRLTRALKTGMRTQSESSRFPVWLNQDFVSRLKLGERWEEIERSWTAPCPHPWRPDAYRSFTGPLWDRLFAQSDADVTGAAAEIRHPFVDLRLLRYMLAIPVVPWCEQKYLLRRAMRKALPAEVLRRPKTPATCDPLWQGLRSRGMATLLPAPELGRYVDFIRVPAEVDQDMMIFWINLRARALNYWLRNVEKKDRRYRPKNVHQKYFTGQVRPISA
jgi:asparagine synthase (glutamine-hydrolysing)